MAEKVLGIHGAPTDRLGGIRRGVFRLTIQILRRSGRLVEGALDLGFRVAGETANTFLRLAAEISCGAGDAISIHGTAPCVCARYVCALIAVRPVNPTLTAVARPADENSHADRHAQRDE